MAGDAQEGPEQLALDRIGSIFEDLAGVAQGVVNRNLKLWSTMSANVRKPNYGADAMAEDAGRAMAVVVDNLEDIYASLLRLPERQQVAAALPTAFLYFSVQEGVERAADTQAERAKAGAAADAEGEEAADRDPLYALAENVWIRVAPGALEGLPSRAAIDLTGPDPGVAALRACLRATKRRGGYLLETYGVVRLKPGSYTGFVYLAQQRPRPLANLRIVVEEP